MYPTATIASATAVVSAMAPIVRREPKRLTIVPARGNESNEPAAIASNTRPSSAGRRCSRSRTCGMRDAQLANANPAKMNAA